MALRVEHVALAKPDMLTGVGRLPALKLRRRDQERNLIASG